MRSGRRGSSSVVGTSRSSVTTRTRLGRARGRRRGGGPDGGRPGRRGAAPAAREEQQGEGRPRCPLCLDHETGSLRHRPPEPSTVGVVVRWSFLSCRRRATLTIAACLALLVSPGCGDDGGTPATPPLPSPRAAASRPRLPDLGPPNVVLIVADDLGWGDLGSYGNRRDPTPNIDRLAAEGARYTSFYVPTPICAASRAGLLTGRFPRARRDPLEPADRLTASEVVIAQRAARPRVRDGRVGKWHLGWDREEMPIHYGFDFYYGLPAGEDETDFILGDAPTTDGVRAGPARAALHPDGDPVHGPAPRTGGSSCTSRTATRTCTTSPPRSSPGRSAAGAYGDVIEQLDASVGDLMKWPRASPGSTRTRWSIFTSDNGPDVPPRGPGRPARIAAGRAPARRAGSRVPAIMALAGADPAGTRGQRAGQLARPLPDPGDPHRRRRCRRSPTTAWTSRGSLTGEVDRIGGRGSTAGVRSSSGAGRGGRPALGQVEVPAAGPLVGHGHALRPGGRSRGEERPVPVSSRARAASSTSG